MFFVKRFFAVLRFLLVVIIALMAVLTGAFFALNYIDTRPVDWVSEYQTFVDKGDCKKAVSVAHGAARAGDPQGYRSMASLLDHDLCQQEEVQGLTALDLKKEEKALQEFRELEAENNSLFQKRISSFLLHINYQEAQGSKVFKIRDTGLYALCHVPFIVHGVDWWQLRDSLEAITGKKDKLLSIRNNWELFCAGWTASFAKDLDEGRYGLNLKQEAGYWYWMAGLRGNFQAQFTYLQGALEERWPQTGGQDAQDIRDGFVIMAVLQAYPPAYPYAARYLLDGTVRFWYEGDTQESMNEEAFRFLREAEKAGMDVSDLMREAKARLTQERIVAIEAELEGTNGE